MGAGNPLLSLYPLPSSVLLHRPQAVLSYSHLRVALLQRSVPHRAAALEQADSALRAHQELLQEQHRGVFQPEAPSGAVHFIPLCGAVAGGHW